MVDRDGEGWEVIDWWFVLVVRDISVVWKEEGKEMPARNLRSAGWRQARADQNGKNIFRLIFCIGFKPQLGHLCLATAPVVVVEVEEIGARSYMRRASDSGDQRYKEVSDRSAGEMLHRRLCCRTRRSLPDHLSNGHAR
jgi:hypothetical protein